MVIQDRGIIQSRYRLLSLKGRGSFGEVWLAKDEKTDMDVAVKVYIALDDKGLEEFKAEYKNSYSLNHPNLLHAYYYDVVDRQPFLVMPYCPDSAESLVGNADEKTLLRFIRDVASGLEYLHARDIIHRDIKPDNILVNQEGSFVITDFGVSSKMKSTLRRNSTRAMAGADVAGTIGYMGPELFSRNPDAVKATDIWALGATVFEMASGEMPFFGQGGALLLRGADIPELRGEWSEGFRNIVDACLARDTWDRPTAAKLVEMADSLLKGRPVDFKATVRIPAAEPQVAQAVPPDGKPVPSAYTVIGKEESEKPKKHSSLIILLIAAILAGIGGLLKVAFTPREPEKPEQKESSQLALPSGSQLYNGEVTMASGKVLKIKRLELNYDTFKGKSYYSDTPLDLDFDLTRVGTLVQLEITETNPNMTRQSVLGGKVTTIYDGTYHSNGTISGRGRNWHGDEFSFRFVPGVSYEEIEKPAAESIRKEIKIDKAASPSKTEIPSSITRANESPANESTAIINRTSIDLFENQTYQLRVSGTSETVNWVSDNESVAYVGTSGLVLGKSPGTTTVKAWLDDIVLTCTVNVKKEPPSSSPSLSANPKTISSSSSVLKESKPEFLGGDANRFSSWVNEQLVYPEVCKVVGLMGTVILQFTVDYDGSLTDIRVVKGVHPLLDAEAKRVVKSSPKWTPGYQNDRPVRVTYTFPVVFALK